MQRLGTDIRMDTEINGQYERLITKAEQGNRTGSLRPLVDHESISAGKMIYESQRNLCYTCHRMDLGGQVGPNLTDDLSVHSCSTSEMIEFIKRGNPLKGMMPYGSGQLLTDLELHQLVSYIKSKKGSNPPNAKKDPSSKEQPCRE